MGRLEAVIQAEDLAFGGSADGNLSALVKKALGAAGSERYRIEPGPPVTLKGPQVFGPRSAGHDAIAEASEVHEARMARFWAKVRPE